jgi:hypothetical protein
MLRWKQFVWCRLALFQFQTGLSAADEQFGTWIGNETKRERRFSWRSDFVPYFPRQRIEGPAIPNSVRPTVASEGEPCSTDRNCEISKFGDR